MTQAVHIILIPVQTKLSLQSFRANAEQYADGSWEARHGSKLKQVASAADAIRFVEYGQVKK